LGLIAGSLSADFARGQLTTAARASRDWGDHSGFVHSLLFIEQFPFCSYRLFGVLIDFLFSVYLRVGFR